MGRICNTHGDDKFVQHFIRKFDKNSPLEGHS
jgi:hypothetical protein